MQRSWSGRVELVAKWRRFFDREAEAAVQLRVVAVNAGHADDDHGEVFAVVSVRK